MKIYIEEQRFSQIWLWIMMIAVNVGVLGQFAYGLYLQIGKGIPYGNVPMSNSGLILTTALTTALLVAVTLLMLCSKLSVRIDNRSININFKPFLMKEKIIKWSDVKSFEVVKYQPINDYGGWGLRLGRKGTAYNVKGNMGLRLTLQNKKTLLIGTSKADELARFLEKLDPLTSKIPFQ